MRERSRLRWELGFLPVNSGGRSGSEDAGCFVGKGWMWKKFINVGFHVTGIQKYIQPQGRGRQKLYVSSLNDSWALFYDTRHKSTFCCFLCGIFVNVVVLGRRGGVHYPRLALNCSPYLCLPSIGITGVYHRQLTCLLISFSCWKNTKEK